MKKTRKGEAPKCKACGSDMRTCIRSTIPGEVFKLGDGAKLNTFDSVIVYLCFNKNCKFYLGMNADALPPALLKLFGYDTKLNRNSNVEDAFCEFRKIWTAYCGEGE